MPFAHIVGISVLHVFCAGKNMHKNIRIFCTGFLFLAISCGAAPAQTMTERASDIGFIRNLWTSGKFENAFEEHDALPEQLKLELRRIGCVRTFGELGKRTYSLYNPVRFFNMRKSGLRGFLILAGCIQHNEAFYIDLTLRDGQLTVERILFPALKWDTGQIVPRSINGSVELRSEQLELVATETSDFIIDVRRCLRHTYSIGNFGSGNWPSGFVSLKHIDYSKGCDFNNAETVTELWKPLDLQNVPKHTFTPK